MAHLSLSLLGPFQVALDGEPVTGFESNKVRALLAYLAVEADRAHRREMLAALFWPDRPDRMALANLRNAIANLRRAIGDRPAAGDCDVTPPFLLITRETIQFNEASDHWLDVAAFRAEADRLTSDVLEERVALYRGNFLEGFLVRGCPAFEDWSLLVRERLQRQVLAALDRLVKIYEEGGDIERARDSAWRRVELAPWEEETHQQLMRLLALSGRRTAALAQYETCRRVLQEELGVEPAPETERLYERIRSGEIGRQEEDETGPRDRLKRSNLPIPLTPFIGRDTALAEIRARLLDPACRLLTLTGAGGSGKTRLALQVAFELVDAFPDGVFLVPLASIRDPALVVSAIAGTLGVRESGGSPLMESLQYVLRDRELLLVVDNFEQVAAAAPDVSELLAAAPRLKVLVTSRSSLHIYGEHEYRVPPMVTPALSTDVSSVVKEPSLERLARVEAVQLFVQRAQAVKADFVLDEENALAVAEMCDRLDGLPLAIELAAARARLLSPRAMLPHLHSRLRFLTGGPRDLPARQRTLRATIDWSYDLLDADEQALFRRLAVFLGGFTMEAAQAVAFLPSNLPASRPSVLDTLESLTDQNLLQVSDVAGEPRFTMLETIREYALERLVENGEAETTRQRHVRFFLALAQEAESELWGLGAAWLDQLEREHDNLRAALAWAIEGDSSVAEAGLRLAGALGHFWAGRGHNSEGRDWLAKALAKSAVDGADLNSWRAKALMWMGWLAYWQNDDAAAYALLSESAALWRTLGETRGLAQALARFAFAAWKRGRANGLPLAEESIALLRQVDDKPGLAFALYQHGYLAYEKGDLEKARASAEESVHLARESGATTVVAAVTAVLGRIAFAQGDYAAARVSLNESLTLSRQARDKWGVGNVAAQVGNVWYLEGDYDQARACYKEGRQICREMGNKWGLASSSTHLGYAALRQGRWKEAHAHLAEALAMCQEFAYAYNCGTAACLVGWAGLAAARGQPERAARLLGAAEVILGHVDRQLTFLCPIEYERIASAVRSQLDEATLAAAWTEGRAMAAATADERWERAIAYALGKE